MKYVPPPSTHTATIQSNLPRWGSYQDRPSSQEITETPNVSTQTFSVCYSYGPVVSSHHICRENLDLNALKCQSSTSLPGTLSNWRKQVEYVRKLVADSFNSSSSHRRGAGGGGGAAAVELPRLPINHLVGGSVPSYCCHVSLNTADRIKGEVCAKHKTSTCKIHTEELVHQVGGICHRRTD